MRRRTVRAVGLASAANFALLGALTAPAIALIPLRVSELVGQEERARSLAALVAIGAAVAVVANPLFGYISDRTRSRWGRRAPWIAGGGAVGTVGVILLAQADGLSMLMVSWALAQAGYNAALAAVAASFADTLTEETRSSASGFFAASTFLGTLPALALVAVFPQQSSAISVAIALFALVPVLGCAALVPRDAPVTSRAAAGRPARGPLRRTFAVLWVQRLVMLLAFGLTTEFSLYLVMDRMGAGADTAASVTAVTTLLGGAALVVAAMFAGILAGRRGNYLPYLVFSSAALAAAAVVRSITSDVATLWIGAAIGGFAMGVFFSVDLALTLRIIPAHHAGRYLGLVNITETVPQVVAPLVAASLLTVSGGDPVSGAADNYAALYSAGAVLAVAAGVLLLFLRGVASRPVSASSISAGVERRQ